MKNCRRYPALTGNLLRTCEVRNMAVEGLIKLSGGKSVLTDDNSSTYTVARGTALVFVSCKIDGKAGRKKLLGEIGEGGKIPSVYYLDDEGVQWYLVIMALESLDLLRSKEADYEEVCAQFANEINLPNYKRLGIEEALAEDYRIFLVKDNAFIYQSQKDEKKTYRKSLDEILRVFTNEQDESSEITKNNLYNCMSLICRKQRIRIAPFSDISAVSSAPSVEEIARVSDFLVRKITLDDQWYQKDVGFFLGFKKEDLTPVVLEPKGTNKYWMVTPYGQRVLVTPEIADSLDDTGYVLYRPLPETELKWFDVFKYTVKELRPRDFVIYLLMMLLGTLIGLLLPELNRLVYDKYIPLGDTSGLLEIGMLLLSFSIGNILFSIVGELSSFRLSAVPKYALEGAIYHRLLNLEQNVLNSMESGELAGRVLVLGKIICSLINRFITAGISFVMSFLYLARMFSYSGKLSATALLMVLTYLAVYIFISYRQIKYQEKELAARTEINSDLYQYLGGIAKLRLSGATSSALLRHIRKYTKYKTLDYQGNRLGHIASVIAGIAPAIYTIILYHAGTQAAIISAGSFMAFNSAFGSFSAAIMSTTDLGVAVMQVKPVFERATFLLSNKPESSGDKEMPGDLSGDIEISNLSFAYNQDEGNVLSEISLHIKKGEYIGIVGPSGCGKSTLVKLILGFEQPTLGRIYCDGKDISSLDKRELRKKFGVVLQNGSLITGSVQENITITAPNTSLERVNQVIKEVGLEKDIESMPMAIHTMLSEGSETISGGQKQRILIARALASNPSVLIFDEATSALDNITQKTVCDTLSKLDATRIVVAHRLSTIIPCDRIIVMDHGRIVEEGNYNQLMDKKGLFYEMAQRQIS